jgi:hypothetical protein
MDPIDPAEEEFLTGFAFNMRDINSSVTDGGDKSGLGQKATRQIVRKIAENGGKVTPSRHIPAENLEIPDIDTSKYTPIALTPDVLAQMEKEAAELVESIVGDVNGEPHIRPQPQVNTQPQGNVQQEMKVVDPDQMEFDFTKYVKAEDVFNVLTDLVEIVKLLRQEVKDLKK